ncbi:MAG: ABC transporter permease [Solobacterium sp.]|nr:ABC transporter permease [Solobacterium sp.]
MGRYVLKRLVLMIPVILAVAVLIFSIMYFVPGNPASLIAGSDATAEEIAIKEHELGLDRPYLVRLLEFLRNMFLKFDFGRSYWTNKSVTEEMVQRLPRTAILAGGAMIIAVLVGIPLGVFAAVHEGTLLDRVTVLLAVIGVSLPTFWLGMLLVLLFSLKLGLLPASGMKTWKAFILPIVAQSLGGISQLTRQSRSSMLEVIRADFVTTARAKGLTERAVIYGHALPNAMLPIISVLGGNLANSLGGSLVIEQVFAIPGIGMYMITAVNNRDYPIVQASVVIISILFSLVVLLTDLAYAAVDPLIRAQFAGPAKKVKKEESEATSNA